MYIAGRVLQRVPANDAMVLARVQRMAMAAFI
jgi:hypothetical protein